MTPDPAFVKYFHGTGCREHNVFHPLCVKCAEVTTTYRSPDKDAARRIWALVQQDAVENNIPQSEWKWQTFAEFWQMYAADQTSRG